MKPEKVFSVAVGMSHDELRRRSGQQLEIDGKSHSVVIHQDTVFLVDKEDALVLRVRNHQQDALPGTANAHQLQKGSTERIKVLRKAKMG